MRVFFASEPCQSRNRSLGQSFYSVLRDKGILNSFGYCRGKDNDGPELGGGGQETSLTVEQRPRAHLQSWNRITQVPSFGGTSGDAKSVLSVLRDLQAFCKNTCKGVCSGVL